MSAAIVFEHQGTLRKITKIVPYGSGGFAVLVPYHEARRGHLLKYPVDYQIGQMERPFEDATQYSAEDRVNLSLHPDGFVQFSGENPGTSEPRGLGGDVAPFECPRQHRPHLRDRGVGDSPSSHPWTPPAGTTRWSSPKRITIIGAAPRTPGTATSSRDLCYQTGTGAGYVSAMIS